MENLTENISSKIAFYLCDTKDESSDEFEILKYGVFAVLHISMAFLFTILFGILTNTLYEIVTITLIGTILKRYSGGVHCSSPNRCLVTGIIVSYIFVLIGKYMINVKWELNYIICVIMLVHSFFILYKKCPVPSENKPLNKEKTRKILRRKSFFIYFILVVIFIANMLLNLFNIYMMLNFEVLYIILGLYMQTLSLTLVGSDFILFLDKVLLKLKI
nr:accessory gene regulator B family protein [uncultured Terrisporobacter sp.]